MCASIHAYICVSACVYVCACVCMHLYTIVCVVHSGEPEGSSCSYGPEADPAYWQRERGEVVGLQVACKARS